MIYDKELVRYKNTNFDHPKGLITFNAIISREKHEQNFDRKWLKQRKYFTSGIHGVNYILEQNTRFAVRLFWFLVVVAASTACYQMYNSLVTLHSKQQLKTVVATSQMPIYKINFPAVAICPRSHVNWLRYRAAEEKFLPPYPDKELKTLFSDMLLALDKMHLANMDSLVSLTNRTIPKIINQMSLDELINFMAFRCDELFVECTYDESQYDCCKIFVIERTEKGICMVFNSMISEESKIKKITDKFYPWKIGKAGEGTGLQFSLRYNKTYHRFRNNTQFGIDVMIKYSYEWSTSLTHIFSSNTQSYIAVTPTITETVSNTRYLHPRQRRCLFSDEKSTDFDRINDLPFNKINCYVKCQQKNMINICNCTMPWFFPKTGARKCTISDLQCIYENRDTFSYIKSPLQEQFIKDSRRGVTCDCVDSCHSLLFLRTLSAYRIPNPNTNFSIIQGDIYIGQSVITKYEARLDYTSFDLIAKFGGILGLTLGASILSLVEIIYVNLKIIVTLFIKKCLQKTKISPKRQGKLQKE